MKLSSPVLSHVMRIIDDASCEAAAKRRLRHAIDPQEHSELTVLSFPQLPIARLTYGQDFLKVEIMSFTLHLSTTLPAAGALSPAALLLRA